MGDVVVNITKEQLVQLLTGLTLPDTNMIRQSEQHLKPLLKHPNCMVVLWQICADATLPVQVRHVAAIVLRKRLPGHYGKWNATDRAAWQQQVYAALAAETIRPVRAGLVGVAAALASVDQGATDTCLEFLKAAVSHADASARELCFWLLSEMTETVGIHWKPQAAFLQYLFESVLRGQVDPTTGVVQHAEASPAVQKAAVQALGQLMSFWADEVEMEGFAPLLPVLLQVAGQHAALDPLSNSNAQQQQNNGLISADEDFLATVLDVLYDLAYSPAPSLQPHTPITIQFALACVQNRSLELRVRDAAALVIATTAEAKPKGLGRSEALLGQVLDVLFQLMQESPESAAGALFESNPAWRQDLEEDMGGGNDDDGIDPMMDDANAPTETSMAQGTLDMLACEIPKKYIWPACLSRCMDRMSRADDAAARKAGVAGLGVIAEGCAEPLTAALSQVLPAVLQSATDPAAQVRECACFCLGQVSEHCQPDILQYASQILPIVFLLLDDASVAVQVTSCYVLEMFCERLEPAAVRPLLDPLVRKLAHMLESTTKRSVQEMAVAALAATAVAAEEEFGPYVTGVANLMVKLLELQDAHLFSLRGRALECMGHVAIAVGRETFRPYFPVTMQSAMEGLTTDSTDLQEFAYAVFANLAKVMKEEFAPALQDLVPHLIEVIEQEERQIDPQAAAAGGQATPLLQVTNGSTNGNTTGAGVVADNNANNNSNGNELSGLDDSDNEDDDGDLANMVLHVRTALLEVKKGAITALGEMAAHTGTAFCPHLEASMQVLQKTATNWHPLVKGEVADALVSMILPSVAAYHGGELSWTKGDINGPCPMSQHTAALVQAVLKEEVALLQDEDKMTVSKACEAVQSVIELTGPHALLPVANDLLTATLNLLTRQAPCQTVDAMYGEAPDDEDDDHDQVMQAACDLVGAVGRVMGNHFAPHLPHFLPAILEYAKSSRPPSDRSMAMGCLSEIAQELGPSIYEHWRGVFLPALLQGLADEDDNVKRNAAFCAGVCCEHLREGVAADYPAILQRIGSIFSTSGTHVEQDAAAACVDNAAAALARMIMAYPQAVPAGQVLPVFLAALPLKTDFTENETVYTCLAGLAQMKHPDLVAHKSEVERIYNQAVVQPQQAAAAAMAAQAAQQQHAPEQQQQQQPPIPPVDPNVPVLEEELQAKLRMALQSL